MDEKRYIVAVIHKPATYKIFEIFFICLMDALGVRGTKKMVNKCQESFFFLNVLYEWNVKLVQNN